ncbi:MAG: ACT domain-containing protein [Candidatus Omnitrophica bacterium]|nr:ACT domain-containing protein [Candidatus Omnitrophota bacterium]
MKIKQLSLFLENKPGSLSLPCRALAQAGLNILTLSLADTEQYGILRLVVPEWERAKKVLETAGCVVKVSEVEAIEVPDRPGGLAEVLEAAEKAGINVEYMYAFTVKRAGKSVLVFRFDEPDAAIEKLQAQGVNFVGNVGLYNHLEESGIE